MKKKKTFEKKAMVRYTGYNPEQEESSMALPINQQLTKVRIQGFKSIKSQEISFNRVNVLIGSNGAGKSNFISAFAFFIAEENTPRTFLWNLFLAMKIHMASS